MDWDITFRYNQGIPTANSRSCHDNIEDRQHKDVYIVTDVGGQVGRVRQIYCFFFLLDQHMLCNLKSIFYIDIWEVRREPELWW